MLNLSQSRVRQIAVICKDVARATAFYRDALGLPFLFAAGPNLAFFDCAGVRLILTAAEGPEQERSTSIVYYLVSDIEGAQRDLTTKGVVFGGPAHMIAQMPDHQLWLAEFADSEGNALVLMEEKR